MPDIITEPIVGIIADRIGYSAPTRPPAVAKSNHASTLGDVCERLLVLRRTRGHEAVPISPGLAGIFETGNLLTPIFLERVFNPFGRKQAPAWEVREQERVPNDALYAKLNIGLRIDGVRHVSCMDGRWYPWNLTEFKTMNPNLFQGIRTLDDLHKGGYTAKYMDQVLLGMFACDLVEHPGWLVLINKSSLYECRIIEVPFDYGRVEQLLKRAERINGHVADKTLPAQPNTIGKCITCEMLPICNPRLVGDPGAAPKIWTKADDPDGEMQAALGDYMLLNETVAEYNHLKSKIRDRLIPGDNLIVGDLTVTWKVHGKGWRMIVAESSG